jgi:hypothetical protein
MLRDGGVSRLAATRGFYSHGPELGAAPGLNYRNGSKDRYCKVTRRKGQVHLKSAGYWARLSGLSNWIGLVKSLGVVHRVSAVRSAVVLSLNLIDHFCDMQQTTSLREDDATTTRRWSWSILQFSWQRKLETIYFVDNVCKTASSRGLHGANNRSQPHWKHD